MLLLVTCVLTQVLYPIGYGMLTGPDWSNAIGATLLAARNGLLVAITVIAVRAGAAADPAGTGVTVTADPPAHRVAGGRSRWSRRC